MAKKAKSHIFSTRKPKARTIKELLNVSDLTTLTWEEKRKLARYTNKEAKKMFRDFTLPPENWHEFITPESQPDSVDAFSKLMKQKEFINWQKVEDEIRSHPQEYAEANAVLEDKDKWTILRRLAAVDPRLNIDRAYASETLRDIEDMIISGEYRDLDAVTDEMMIRYIEIGRMNKTWDSDLHDFAKRNPAEDSKLYANEGFHGVRKAEERYEREKRRDLSGYAPMWQSPMWFDD